MEGRNKTKKSKDFVCRHISEKGEKERVKLNTDNDQSWKKEIPEVEEIHRKFKEWLQGQEQ